MFCFAIVAPFFSVSYSFSLLLLFLDVNEQTLSFSFLADSFQDSEQLTCVQLAQILPVRNISRGTNFTVIRARV